MCATSTGPCNQAPRRRVSLGVRFQERSRCRLSPPASASALSGGRQSFVKPMDNAQSSNPGGHSNSGNNAASTAPTPLLNNKRPMNPNRSAEELRRNGLNMEKMIKKNVLASSRPGSLKRGMAVVEYFKAKQQQESESQQGEPKRKKPQDTTSERTTPVSTPSASASAAPQTQASELITPSASRNNSLTAVAVPTGSTSEERFVPRGPPAITRVSQLMMSPSRLHGSPKKPPRQLLSDDSRRRSSENSGALGLSGAQPQSLDHVEITTAMMKPGGGSMKSPSPFQSLQSKLVQRSPMKMAPGAAIPLMASPPPNATRQHVRPRTGPSVVDLTSTSPLSPQPRIRADLTRQMASPNSMRSPGRGIASPISVRAPPPAPVSVPAPSKSARSLFSAPQVVATKSICFSMEGVVTTLDVTPDGEIIVAGFTDGSVRLYEMDSTVPSDRHGYLLGHIDEELERSGGSQHLRLKITADGRYVFVGCRTGPRVMMSIHLYNYRNEKENDDDDFEHLQKDFHSSARLRGFADVTKYVPPNGVTCNRNAYYVACGLGVGNLNIWRFVEPAERGGSVKWNYLYTIACNGNTATVASFLPPNPSEDNTNQLLGLAAICEDRNVRVWSLQHEQSSETSSELDLPGMHTSRSHTDIPNTKDIVNFEGKFAYAITATGQSYRVNLFDSSSRHVFNVEKLDHAGSGKSRRSMIMLESVFASEKGDVVITVSTEGIFYYAKNVPTENAPDDAMPVLRIIGKNASLHPHFKTPMKVYMPQIQSQGRKRAIDSEANTEAMMAVVTNPASEDEGEGYFNVDPTETFADRWMKPSRGKDCWVCGVRNISHWSFTGEQPSKINRAVTVAKPKTTGRKSRNSISRSVEASPKRRVSAPAAVRTLTVAADTDPTKPRTRLNKYDAQPTVATSKASNGAAKSTPREEAGSPTQKKNQPVPKPSVAPSSAAPTPENKSTKSTPSRSKVVAESEDDDGSATGNESAADQAEDPKHLRNELERYKERYNQIVVEWQRRLKGERQMRRLWKNREADFNQQLNETFNSLDAAQQEIEKLQTMQRDSEKRFIFEKLKADQQSSVKVRYQQLCEQMQAKLAQVDDQKRLMEQTTRTLLQEVERNVQSLKTSAGLETNECIVCKDKPAVTAIVPCGHLCFCEEDGETYRHNSPVDKIVCPICQRELISLLRIY